MNKLSINKNVPLPKTICGRTPEEHSYPFEKMQKGDSFFVKGNNERNYYTGYNELYAHIYNRMYDYRKSINKSKPFVETVQFTIRAVEGGYRCWRTR